MKLCNEAQIVRILTRFGLKVCPKVDSKFYHISVVLPTLVKAGGCDDGAGQGLPWYREDHSGGAYTRQSL